MKFFTKTTITFALLSTLVMSNANSALVLTGLSAAPAIAVIAGGASAGFLIFGAADFAERRPSRLNLTLGAAFLLLDKESGEVEFKEITSEIAKKSNLTSDEFIAYNNELDAINASVSELNSGLINESLSQGEVLEGFKATVSTDAHSAVVKLLNMNSKN